MRKQYVRRIMAALMAVALGVAAVGVGQSQQASAPQTPQIMADPGNNGGGTGG